MQSIVDIQGQLDVYYHKVPAIHRLSTCLISELARTFLFSVVLLNSFYNSPLKQHVSFTSLFLGTVCFFGITAGMQASLTPSISSNKPLMIEDEEMVREMKHEMTRGLRNKKDRQLKGGRKKGGKKSKGAKSSTAPASAPTPAAARKQKRKHKRTPASKPSPAPVPAPEPAPVPATVTAPAEPSPTNTNVASQDADGTTTNMDVMDLANNYGPSSSSFSLVLFAITFFFQK